MITKKQWVSFCNDVQKAYSLRMEPFIAGRRVIKVDTYNHKITTSIAGDPNKYVYTFEDSVADMKSEYQLRKSVMLRADLLSIKLFRESDGR